MHQLPQVANMTWYPGSVRPYASLWHTVMRVAALSPARELRPSLPAQMLTVRNRFWSGCEKAAKT